MHTGISLMFDKLRNLDCPNCHTRLDSFNERVLVKREEPAWNQISQYYVYPCKHCLVNLRIENQTILLLLFFTYFLVSGVLYFVIYDLSKLLAGVAMLVSAIPFLFLGAKFFKLVKDT